MFFVNKCVYLGSYGMVIFAFLDSEFCAFMKARVGYSIMWCIGRFVYLRNRGCFISSMGQWVHPYFHRLVEW